MNRASFEPSMRHSLDVPAASLEATAAAPAPAAPALSLVGNMINGHAAAFIHEARVTLPLVVPAPDNAIKFRTVRNVAAGAAHDMANMLCVVGFELDALNAETLSPEGVQALRSLRAESAYLRDLARELQMVARETEEVTVDCPTRLAAWWPDMRILLRSVHRDCVILRGHIPWGLPPVCIKPHQLTQIVLNLVGNSVNAIAERPPTPPTPTPTPTHSPPPAPSPLPPPRRRRLPGLSIVTQTDPADSASTYGRIDVSARLETDGRMIRLDVADNGIGMTPRVRARACEHFFTTRADRGGTGLGLAMVRRLVEEVGGSVQIRSAVNIGTTVSLRLPARIEAVSVQPPPVPTPTPPPAPPDLS